MRAAAHKHFTLSIGLLCICALAVSHATDKQEPEAGFRPAVPHAWDDHAMQTLELPVAGSAGSRNQVPADYYYKIPVRPIYKSYPIYAPGHEPSGYIDWLKKQEPKVVWDASGNRPTLQTREDWVKAGEPVFDSSPFYDSYDVAAMDVRQPAWYRDLGVPIPKDGVMPFGRYVIRKKGEIELSGHSCATCHTRVMPDGSTVKGAQGNFPFERILAFGYRLAVAAAKEPARALNDVRVNERFLYTVPWVQPNPLADLNRMSVADIAARHEQIPPGVIARHGTSVFYPAQVPDLIGVKDRAYLDHTGLQQHRGIVDLMRYGALNQGADDLANYDGFVPADFGEFKKLPEPANPELGGRFSDEQLYALALYVYSLRPPPNPNKFDAVARHGHEIFERQGCAKCHTPRLYTNNKLTPAEGFGPPPDDVKQYNVLLMSVGTDPNMTMKTRRGTGYYKVPSLEGVWYRAMFGHSGWCATLEDWFNPLRVKEDYVPTGFKPYGAKTFAVKGHLFGLELSPQDRATLIAFLKTL